MEEVNSVRIKVKYISLYLIILFLILMPLIFILIYNLIPDALNIPFDKISYLFIIIYLIIFSIIIIFIYDLNKSIVDIKFDDKVIQIYKNKKLKKEIKIKEIKNVLENEFKYNTCMPYVGARVKFCTYRLDIITEKEMISFKNPPLQFTERLIPILKRYNLDIINYHEKKYSI